MERVGLYTQLSEFTKDNAGTSEWCKAERNGKEYFVKKFQNPVYPKKDIGLPEKMYNAGVAEFKEAVALKTDIYQRLRRSDQSGVLVVPLEVINYQFHICTIADYVVGNIYPEQICQLSEWQRLVLMRTLTLALMNVHSVGIVHSDMKPDNILIKQDEKGHCKLHLIDFDGSFLEESPPTDPEEVVGDPTFFAPEAYRLSMDESIRLDHRIDIFALGIIFHYFWSGNYPIKPAEQYIGECLVRGGTVMCQTSIPPVLKQLITKMISADPNNRPTLKSIYDVLGIQIANSTPSVINLQPKEKSVSADKTEKKAEIRIDCCDEHGKLLKYRTLLIPYGTKRYVEAETISGYHCIGLSTKAIVVDAKGNTDSPIKFEYKSDTSVVEEKKKGRKFLRALLWTFVIYWIIMFLFSMGSYGNAQYSEAKKYMDLTPFFSVIFETTYDDCERMLNREGNSGSSNTASATRGSATVTPRPATTSAPTRHFAVNTNVTFNKGKTTVRWTDTQNAGPYYVSYEYYDGGSAVQSSFWAGEDRSGSTTSNKYFVIDDLIPGHQYIIEITDRNDNIASGTIRVPNTSDFIDGRLEKSSISVSTSYRHKDAVNNVTEIDKFSARTMKEQISNTDCQYGLRYEITVPQLSQSREYFEQLVFYAPNGYAQTVVSSNAKYDNTTSGSEYYWNCIGGYFFELLLKKNGTIPTGKYTVELYWDGMLVNRSYFYVE